MKKIVLSTGGFDPVHSGHISYLKASREQGDLLIVGVNSDDWLIRKKGQYFLPIKERMSILESFKFVEKVIEFDDSDNSACDAILKVRHLYPDYKIIFANGGDRNEKNILESKICDRNLEFKFGIGGVEKLNSSSKILENWKNMTVEKPWGKYKLLLNSPFLKVKELIVYPGKTLSRQRHFFRSEIWFCSEGVCQVEIDNTFFTLTQNDKVVSINKEQWHRLSNPNKDVCKIIEVQYGEKCIEEDIERQI